jgi:hypothetical protein
MRIAQRSGFWDEAGAEGAEVEVDTAAFKGATGSKL